MKKVIWTPTARRSLRKTSTFITELWNEEVKAEFLNQLNFRITQIQKNPELAPTFEDSDFRKLVIHKSVSLFLSEPARTFETTIDLGQSTKSCQTLSTIN